MNRKKAIILNEARDRILNVIRFDADQSNTPEFLENAPMLDEDVRAAKGWAWDDVAKLPIEPEVPEAPAVDWTEVTFEKRHLILLFSATEWMTAQALKDSDNDVAYVFEQLDSWPNFKLADPLFMQALQVFVTKGILPQARYDEIVSGSTLEAVAAQYPL